VKHGWTFILVRSGEDPYAALRTARLYAPAVVWVEDLDVISAGKTRAEITRLLDVLDNIQVKGQEVMAGFTTNFAKTIDKGVLRPGRIDSVIHIGSLDAGGYERLVKVLIAPGLLGEVDYKQVAEAFHGFLPAFAVEAAQRAIRYSVIRDPSRPPKITTRDLVEAAKGLYAQLQLVEGAGEAAHAKPTMDTVLTSHVEEVIRRTSWNGLPLEVAKSNGR
jgi:transitional endoplasmic reticulum ATPase